MSESSYSSAPLPKPPSDRSFPAASNVDKRQYPRFKVDDATAVLGKPGLLASLGLGPIRHSVINLSQGGAMVRFAKSLAVDSRHELRIEIPKYREVIEAVGEIRWCGESVKRKSEFYLGIQFVDLPAAELRKLSSMYEWVSSAEYRARSAARKDASAVNLKAPRS